MLLCVSIVIAVPLYLVCGQRFQNYPWDDNRLLEYDTDFSILESDRMMLRSKSTHPKNIGTQRKLINGRQRPRLRTSPRLQMIFIPIDFMSRPVESKTVANTLIPLDNISTNDTQDAEQNSIPLAEEEDKKVPLPVTRSLCGDYPEDRLLFSLGPHLQQFVVCFHGLGFVANCPDGMMFDQDQQACTSDYRNTHVGLEYDDKLATITIGHQLSYFLNYTDGSVQLQRCPDGLVFDGQSCLEPENDKLSAPSPCRFLLDGLHDFLPCSPVYLRCDAAEFAWLHCPPSQYFSRRWQMCLSECDLPRDDVCKYKVLDGPMDADHRLACSNFTVQSYYDGLKWLVQRRLTRAVQNPCSEYADVRLLGTYLPAHLICMYGQPYWKVCPDGTELDLIKMECTPNKGKIADFPVCMQDVNGLKALDGCSGTYVQCVNGRAYSRTCTQGKVFYNVTSSCVEKKENAFCELRSQGLCPGKDGSYSLQACSDKYVACLQGTPYVQSCPDGKAFLNLTNSCVDRNEHPFCSVKSTSPCTAGKNELVALDGCSGTFIQCLNGKATNHVCKNGQVFLPTKKLCVPRADNPFCTNPLCPAQGSSLQSLQPCSGTYVMCKDGIGTNRQCPDGQAFYQLSNSCVPQHLHPGCPEPEKKTCSTNGAVWMDIHDCTVFHRCINGRVVRNRCPEGMAFNERFRLCDKIERVEACKQMRQ